MRSYLTLVACLLFPCSAFAQYSSAPMPSEQPADAGAKTQGAVLSFATGYGVPFGDIIKSRTQSVSLSDGISGQIPLTFAAGYRLHQLFSFGLAFTYAPLLTKNCDSGSSCSARDIVLEGELRLHMPVNGPFAPWISTGFGYEWFHLSESGGDNNGSASLEGFTFGFQVGGDYLVTPSFALGPFLGIRLGEFGHISSSSGSQSASADIPDANQAWHGWIAFGLRGAFTI